MDKAEQILREWGMSESAIQERREAILRVQEMRKNPLSAEEAVKQVQRREAQWRKPKK